MLIFENYFYILYLAAFFSSIVSAAIGFVGGTMMLVAMAQFLKMEFLIPLHAIIQLSSNLTRSFVLRNHINWKIGKDSIAGALIGMVAGYFYLKPINSEVFNIIIGIFVIVITLLPKTRLNFNFYGKWILVGFLSCFFGLYVGAIGIFIGSILLGENLEKKPMVATQALQQSLIHLAKIIVFSLLGFSLAPWILLILGAIICTYCGTLIGAKVLNYIEEKTFRKIITWVILIMALKLVFAGFMAK